MAVSLESRPALPLSTDMGAPRRRFRSKKLRQTAVAYLFLLPALAVIGVFHFFPLFYAFWISLRKWTVADLGMVWFKNYGDALHDHAFWQSLGTTVYFAIGTVPVTMALACLIAYLLFQKVRFLGVFRTLYFLPFVTSTVAAASVWLWIFNPTKGVANNLLQHLGFGRLRWMQEPHGIVQMLGAQLHVQVPGLLQGPSLALVAVILVTIWHQLGFQVVIFLVGLGNIPREVYEAARIDGAGERQLFFRITLPLLAPIIYFLAIISTIGAFQEFNEIYIMSVNSNIGVAPGGPLRTTQTVMVNVFNQFRIYNRLGYGSAIAFVLFVIIMAMTVVQLRLGRRYAQFE